MTEEEFIRRVTNVGYGPYLWQICDRCNYNDHRCHFCGDDLTHAEAVNHTHPCYKEVFDG